MARDEKRLKLSGAYPRRQSQLCCSRKGSAMFGFVAPGRLHSGQKRVVGPAFTLRFVPAREDRHTPESWASPISTRAAIEAMPKGCVAVVDAMGITDAGIFGDILCERMRVRGVAGLVTDGVVRDVAGVIATGLPVWCKGAAAPPSVAGLLCGLAGSDRLWWRSRVC